MGLGGLDAEPMGSQSELNCVQRHHSPGHPAPVHVTGHPGVKRSTGTMGWHAYLVLVDQEPKGLRFCYTHMYVCMCTHE